MKSGILLIACIFCHAVTAQKLDIGSLEKITYASIRSADSLLKSHHFALSDKQVTKDYSNYYYTSYERKDLFDHLLRSITIMDVYGLNDTSRLVLYRTYYVEEQEELTKQLLTGGYEMKEQVGKSYIYKKNGFTVTHKISEKKIMGAKPRIAYEFETGR